MHLKGQKEKIRATSAHAHRQKEEAHERTRGRQQTAASFAAHAMPLEATAPGANQRLFAHGGGIHSQSGATATAGRKARGTFRICSLKKIGIRLYMSPNLLFTLKYYLY